MNEKDIKKTRETVKKMFPQNTDKAAFCYNVLLKHTLMHSYKPDYNEQSHLLLTGQTGSGKSHMIETIAALFDLPFLTVDATALTESGYQGRSVEDIYQHVYDITGKRKDLFSKAVVFIDEFDKLAFKDEESQDVSCRGVQYSLLKGMDGIDVPIANMPQIATRNRIDEQVPVVNTRGVLFIAAGAFSQCEPPVTREAIVQSGFYPELIARFSTVLHLQNSTEKQIRKLLNTNSLFLDEYKLLFSSNGKTLEFTTAFKDYLARKTAAMDYNLRGLKMTIDELLIPVLDMLNDPDFKTLTVDWAGNKFELRKAAR